MTYRIRIIKLDGSEEFKDVSWNLDVTRISKFYTNQKFINVELVETKCSPFSGDIEEVVYKEVINE